MSEVKVYPFSALRASFGNRALAAPLSDQEQAQMIAAAAQKVDELLRILRVDVENDHNTRETPGRVARMFVNEIMNGRYTHPPVVTEFDNVTAASELIVTGPLAVRSTCALY